MPKTNKKGGNKYKKGKKQVICSKHTEVPTEGQYIANVINKLGNGRVIVRFKDSKGVINEIHGMIRNGTKRRCRGQYVNVGKYIIVAEREFSNVVDIVHIYSDTDVTYLKSRRILDDSLETGKTGFHEDCEFNDFVENEPEKPKEKIRGLGRDNIVKENYGIESSDEEEEEEEC
jgi:hypothetical protein